MSTSGGHRASSNGVATRARTTRPLPAPKPPKPPTVAQRTKTATQGIVSSLGIPDAPAHEKAAVMAALEAISERLASDSDLRESVRQKYQEIAVMEAQKPQKADLGPTPIPIRSGTPEQFTPYGTFDPYRLVWQYGEHQLRAVLLRGTQRDLREAVSAVQARKPGTAPRNKASKDAMIDYIMEYVAGPGY